MLPLVIRSAGIEHIPTIRALAHEIWPPTYGAVLSQDQLQYMLALIYSEAALREQISTQRHQFVIGDYEGQAKAFASYSPKTAEDTTLYRLHKIYLHPELQGKGAGRQLLDHVLQAVRLAGGTSIELNVNRSNPAYHFYLHCGFTVTDTVDIPIGQGYYMNDYVMRRSL